MVLSALHTTDTKVGIKASNLFFDLFKALLLNLSLP
jgi:hypothetical protein